MFYAIIILVAMVLTASLNAIFEMATFLYSAFAVTLLTVAVILIDGLFAFIIRRLPERYFDYRRKIYRVEKKERKFYKAIGVKSWRGLVLDLGMFTSFSKSRFSKPDDPLYTGRFLLESCYGVIIHVVCVIVGFSVMAIIPRHALGMGLPVALVNAVLNILPIFVLRYNTPKIATIHERNLRKKSKKDKTL